MAVDVRDIYGNQKIENLLNLAMDATLQEREKSPELEVGYDPQARTWELIIKYSGDLKRISELAEETTALQNEYAIVTVQENRIEALATLSEVEYIEKPKRLFFEVENGRRVSCIDAVQESRFSLSGQGVLIGVIDSGIDYTLSDFQTEDGGTRILALWDQTLGKEYTRDEINEALMSATVEERLERLPSMDDSGHGTAVAGIAAGNGRNSPGERAGGGEAWKGKTGWFSEDHRAYEGAGLCDP